MYDGFGHLFDGLYDAGMPANQIAVLRSIFLKCSARLRHAGPVDIKGYRPAGATDAMLTLANYRLPAGVDNGCALKVEAGEACFEDGADFAAGTDVDFTGTNVTGLAAAGAAVCWGKATADQTLGAVGWNTTVPVNVVTDRTGATATGDTATVYVRRTSTADPNIRQDDVIAFFMDENGLAVAHGDYFDGFIGELRTCNATTGYPKRGWQLADGTNSTIDMRDALAGGYKSGGVYGTIGNSYGNSIAAIGDTGNNIAASSEATGITVDGHTITFDTRFTGNTAEVLTSYPALNSLTSTNPHAHTVTDSGHDHEIDSAAVAAELTAPLTKAVVWIQRVS